MIDQNRSRNNKKKINEKSISFLTNKMIVHDFQINIV